MPEPAELLLRLVLAHLAGDFLLLPAQWQAAIATRGWRSPGLYAHGILQAVVALAAFWYPAAWPWAAIIGIAHLVTAWQPVRFRSRIVPFLLTQLFHFVLIALITWQQSAVPLERFLPASELPWKTLIAVVFVTAPASEIIRLSVSRWQPPAGEQYSGLVNAGRWIGIIERLLILTFVLHQRWEFVGFLIAAKSVFRFGDLRQATDIRLTEYMLIGTLLSFGLAVLAGLWAAG